MYKKIQRLHNGPECGLVKYFFSRVMMRIVGWKVTGQLPWDKKFVLIGEPHTSNWDFLLMFGAAYSLGLNISWLGKDSIFKFPFGTIMKWFGGIPIDRSKKHKLVEKIIKVFNGSDRFVVVIGPSGTRSKREYWKSGFYWIAHSIDIPVVCGYLDFINKIVHIGLVFTPTGNLKADMDKVRRFYKGIHGRHPEKENIIRLRDE
jgi:1-acyl-sn-glycerol-3-phosphate acyltransferase